MLTAKLSRLSSKYNWKSIFPEHTLKSSALTYDWVEESSTKAAVTTPTVTAIGGSRRKDETSLTGKEYQKQRHALAQSFYDKYNSIVFNDLLPNDTSITWNKRMLKKAGQAVLTTDTRAGTKTARIELSEKMLTDVERLKNTLLHEMCHVANWLLDDVEAGLHRHHGPMFKKWANLVNQRVPEVVVSTYHTYEAHKPFHFQCTTESCQIQYKRHSKKGIDTTKHVCGKCRGKLEYMGKFDVNGTVAKTRVTSAYSLFVKENYSSVKKKNSKLANSDLLKKIAEMYKASQQEERQQRESGNACCI